MKDIDWTAGMYVVVVAGDCYDSHAARTLEEAVDLANPDEGAELAFYFVEDEDDAMTARLPYVYRNHVRLEAEETPNGWRVTSIEAAP